MSDLTQDNIEKIAEWLKRQDWYDPPVLQEVYDARARENVKFLLHFLASLGFVQLDKDQSWTQASVGAIEELCRRRGLDFYVIHDFITDLRRADRNEQARAGFRRVILPQEKGK